jgi:hypothetical protein
MTSGMLAVMPSQQATYEDANLILKIYELRREEKLREARAWFSAHFFPASMEDVMAIAPPGSPENAYVRMVISYWEMVASFITAGVLNQDLFFQTGGELLACWEKIKAIAPGMRDMMKNPNAWKNLELVGTAYVKYIESSGPEAYPAYLAMLKMMAPAKK